MTTETLASSRTSARAFSLRSYLLIGFAHAGWSWGKPRHYALAFGLAFLWRAKWRRPSS